VLDRTKLCAGKKVALSLGEGGKIFIDGKIGEEKETGLNKGKGKGSCQSFHCCEGTQVVMRVGLQPQRIGGACSRHGVCRVQCLLMTKRA